MKVTTIYRFSPKLKFIGTAETREKAIEFLYNKYHVPYKGTETPINVWWKTQTGFILKEMEIE